MTSPHQKLHSKTFLTNDSLNHLRTVATTRFYWGLTNFVLAFQTRLWYNMRHLRHQESRHGKVSCARRAEHHVGGNPQGLDAIRVRVDENKRFQRQGLPVSNEMDSPSSLRRRPFKMFSSTSGEAGKRRRTEMRQAKPTIYALMCRCELGDAVTAEEAQ